MSLNKSLWCCKLRPLPRNHSENEFATHNLLPKLILIAERTQKRPLSNSWPGRTWLDFNLTQLSTTLNRFLLQWRENIARIMKSIIYFFVCCFSIFGYLETIHQFWPEALIWLQQLQWFTPGRCLISMSWNNVNLTGWYKKESPRAHDASDNYSSDLNLDL